MNAASRVSWTATGLAGAAALTGLVVPEVYPADAGTDAMLRGYDLVTVALVVPCLAWAVLAQRHPGPHVGAHLVELSLLTYLAYTYVYYVLGAGFTRLLLVHVAVLVASAAALVLGVARVRTSDVALSVDPRTHVRPAAVILGALAAALGGMWVYWSLHAAATGAVPPGSSLVESDTIVQLGVVLDLVVLVPLYAVAAALLWRRSPWGFVLGVVALVAGLFHQLSYAVALLAQHVADVPDAVLVDPVEPVIVLLYAVAAATLLRGLRHPPARTVPQPRTGLDDSRRSSHAHAR